MGAAFIHDRRFILTAILGIVATVLAATSAWLGVIIDRKNEQIATQERLLRSRPFDAVQGTRAIVIKPSRSGELADSMASIGGERAELAEFRFDMGWSRPDNFRVTIDRVGHGRLAVLTNLVRDSNGHVRVAFNSAALGPGDYQVQLEGMDWRGNITPQGWARFTVRQ